MKHYHHFSMSFFDNFKFYQILNVSLKKGSFHPPQFLRNTYKIDSTFDLIKMHLYPLFENRGDPDWLASGEAY